MFLKKTMGCVMIANVTNVNLSSNKKIYIITGSSQAFNKIHKVMPYSPLWKGFFIGENVFGT